MRRLTMRQVTEDHGGILPADAILIPDGLPSDRPAARKPARRPAERFAILNAFADVSLPGLNESDVKIWLILFRDTKAGTGTARTGQADIARRAGLSLRGVQKSIARLEGRGLLQVVRRGRLNGGPSVYRVQPTGNDD